MKVELEATVFSNGAQEDPTDFFIVEGQRVTVEPLRFNDDRPARVIIALPSDEADRLDGVDFDLEVVVDVAELQRAIGYCKDEARGGG